MPALIPFGVKLGLRGAAVATTLLGATLSALVEEWDTCLEVVTMLVGSKLWVDVRDVDTVIRRLGV